MASEAARIIADCVAGYEFLTGLSADERLLAEDRYQKRRDLWESLHESCRAMA